jgi:hypothetical protein
VTAGVSAPLGALLADLCQTHTNKDAEASSRVGASSVCRRQGSAGDTGGEAERGEGKGGWEREREGIRRIYMFSLTCRV